MTLPSLRKLRTTLWSILPEITTKYSRKGLMRLPRLAVVGAAVSTLTLAGSADGGEWRNRSQPDVRSSQRAVPLNARAPQIRLADYVDSSDSGIRQTAFQQDLPAAPLRIAQVPPAITLQDEHSAVEPAPMVLPGVLTTEFDAAPAADGYPSGHFGTDLALNPSHAPVSYYTWSQHYRRHMDAVLCPDYSCDEPVGAVIWWQQNVQPVIDDHTLPPQIEPDVATYDVTPRLIEFGPVRQASAQETSSETSALARLTRDISRIQPTLDYALEGVRDKLPEDFDEKMDNGAYVARVSAPTVLQWAPTNLYHNPLYFEDPALERYGHTYHPLIQPFASTGRFATQLVRLPYQMTLHPVHAKEYTLGYYRPGECAPKKHYQIPFNEEATFMQVAAMAGLILIIP
ncbi:MAG: hypothetical protein R3C20_18210 [Planctomycetaceae bacterium]